MAQILKQFYSYTVDFPAILAGAEAPGVVVNDPKAPFTVLAVYLTGAAGFFFHFTLSGGQRITAGSGLPAVALTGAAGLPAMLPVPIEVPQNANLEVTARNATAVPGAAFSLLAYGFRSYARS